MPGRARIARMPLLLDPTAPPRTLGSLVWSELRLGVVLCVAVAGFLSLAFDDPFGQNLVYSLCIGLTIQGLIEAGRHGFVARARRRSPAAAGPIGAWPGWAVMGPWIGLSVVVGYGLGSLVAGALTGTDHLARLLRGDLRALSLILPVVLVVSIGTTYYFYARGRLAAIELQVQAARRAAAENQLRLLESQLEPHMLFNTLANLRVLIASDPPRAQAMLDRLIAFLRATLNASRGGRHTLAAEFERLADYLALMAVRMGPRLSTRLELPGALRDEPVPPLLLQPLVENGIEHGLEPRVEGGAIEVSAHAEGATLVLAVRDTGVGLPAGGATRPGGFGLAQVRERLATLFGAAASVQLEPATDGRGGTLVTLRLPLPTPRTTAGTP